MKMQFKFRYVLFGILFLALIPLYIYVFGELWNWLVPELFNGPVITFWQAAGILLLSKMLFGRMGGGGWGGRHKHCGGNRMHWKMRWESMSDEQRRAYRNRWCGPASSRSDDAPVQTVE
jgi:hypothetical protein